MGETGLMAGLQRWANCTDEQLKEFAMRDHFEIIKHSTKSLLDKLKASADTGPDGTNAELTPNEAILAYRLLTEHLCVRHDR